MLYSSTKNMEKIAQYLEQLNLSEVEAKIYITLLQTGAISVKSLAQKTDIKRTTTYFYIDQLAEKGLVTKVVQGTQKQVAPSGLDSLEQLVKEKIETAHTLQQELPDILKTISTTFQKTEGSESAEIKYYKGKLGVKKIYEEALKAKELRSYVNITIMSDKLPENSILFADALKNKTIKIFEIIEDSITSREQTQFQTENANNERYFYKFLPKKIKLFAADTLIYDGKVAIINIEEKISGVVLTNAAYYNNTKELFDFNWETLPNPQK